MIIIILLTTFAFFTRLFFPIPKIFYTPDFGQSDIWNFNYPIKEFLNQSLGKGSLPFWSKDIATGFPFFAEGQIGTLNLFNLLLFSLLPTWLAWNLSYLIIFLIAFVGVYFFLKQNRCSSLASYFGGFIFSFSGFFICHISHFNLIQAASFLPWLFYFCQKFFKKKNMLDLFLLGFILCQQIFSGHPQITFISLIGLMLFFFYLLKENAGKENLFKISLLFLIAIILGFALALPQLLPSWELLRVSSRQTGLTSKEIFQFPYPLKHLITFIRPNYYGTAKNGTYPPFEEGWGIYWENTAYLGLLPLLFCLISLFSSLNILNISSEKLKKQRVFFWVLLFVSLLLVLGANSPLYFLFTFPGFSYFRVPSRFLLLSIFGLSFLAAAGFDQLLQKLKKIIKTNALYNSLIIAFLGVAVFDLSYFGYNYHPLVEVQKALSPPATTQLIPEDARLFTHFSQLKSWNKFFIFKGWQKIEPYLYFKNGLAPNLNLLFNKPNINAFYALPPLRQKYFQELTNLALLNASSVEYIISTDVLELKNWGLIKKVTPELENLPSYFIYQNQQSLPRFRLSTKVEVAKTLKELQQLIDRDDFSFQNTVILEQDIREDFSPLEFQEISILHDENQKIILQTKTDKKSILVIADSFYPGWEAKIDGQKTKIMPANLNQRALILSPGEHLIELKYVPRTFYQGVFISLASLVLYLLFWRSSRKTSSSS